MAYDSIQPIGERGAYWRAGLIASTLLNVHRGKKRAKLVRPEDLMPVDGEIGDAQDVAARVVEIFRRLVPPDGRLSRPWIER